MQDKSLKMHATIRRIKMGKGCYFTTETLLGQGRTKTPAKHLLGQVSAGESSGRLRLREFLMPTDPALGRVG